MPTKHRERLPDSNLLSQGICTNLWFGLFVADQPDIFQRKIVARSGRTIRSDLIDALIPMSYYITYLAVHMNELS